MLRSKVHLDVVSLVSVRYNCAHVIDIIVCTVDCDLWVKFMIDEQPIKARIAGIPLSQMALDIARPWIASRI